MLAAFPGAGRTESRTPSTEDTNEDGSETSPDDCRFHVAFPEDADDNGWWSDRERWEAPNTDDPISDWDQDIVGRASIIELLADYALRLRTPVVALHGALGDGKTSVLNLLRRAVEGQAIVVSFSAWLPGSEATLALDLFGDIATECSRYIYVPRLRKRLIAYARTLAGSISYLAGLKELLPSQAQRDEVQELRNTFARIPLPILVLIDEIDRMQEEELLVLLKVLRGASSIRNVSFVCAFSKEEVRRLLLKDKQRGDDYLEKFFPVAVNLPAIDSDLLGRLFQAHLKEELGAQRWFADQEAQTAFTGLSRRLWKEPLCRLCTNIRKAGLLVNSILAAGRTIAGEVHPFDLMVIETLRRFYPGVYQGVRNKQQFLTLGGDSLAGLAKVPSFAEVGAKQREAFLSMIEQEIEESKDPDACRALLCWLFPPYASSVKAEWRYSLDRPTTEAIAETEKRICSPDYFSIYFRASVPEKMFSIAELERMLDLVNRAETEADVESALQSAILSKPSGHPKREDGLWKLSRCIDRLNDTAAERIAYVTAKHASDYSYDILHIGEGSRAVNLVFTVAQKLSATTAAERTLVGSMARCSDDTFARKLVEFTVEPKRNKILTDFSNISAGAIRHAFISRMRQRYGRDVDPQIVGLSQGDWWAFGMWLRSSDDDRAVEQDFWRRFIGQSRKRLAQATNFIYPRDVLFEQDPTATIDGYFPTGEIRHLLGVLQGNDLDEIEQEGIKRMEALLQGNYQTSPFDLDK